MRTTKAERQAQWFARMADLGFSYEESTRLRRIEMTLQRWAEAECNGEIQRDERTQIAYRHYGNGSGPFQTVKVADRQRGAANRALAIMASHPDLKLYMQGDCRGCMLYVLRASDVKPGETLDSVYTRGVAVCY
jgi:hypothetical protein